MRKKLSTRFPASRIKKIMQADEDVGKIALAVPVLVSKALELFLQDLCDKTYDITLRRGMKTMSSLHLKQCIQSFNVFDFLRDVVSKVPELGGIDATDDKPAKRRKTEGNESDEDARRPRIHYESGLHSSSSTSPAPQGRGRGRGRGRRSGRGVDRDGAFNDKCEDDPDMPPSPLPSNRTAGGLHCAAAVDYLQHHGREQRVEESGATAPALRNFDLNLDLDENGNVSPSSATAAEEAADSAIKNDHDDGCTKQQKQGFSSGGGLWPGSAPPGDDMGSKYAMDPSLQFASSLMNQLGGLVEEEEDYDEEG